VTIGASRLSIGKDGSAAIDATHDVPVTFGGSASVTIQPGQIVVSDAVSLAYTYGQTLAVSMYLSGTFPALTQHDSLFPNNFATTTGAGNKTSDTSGASFTNTTQEWLLLNGVDVYGPYQGTVVLFGSSTTEGYKSDYGATNSYPTPNVQIAGQFDSRPSDLLAQRLNAAGYTIGVINAGINSNTVTTNVDSQGQTAVVRLSRDVLQQPGVIAMVMYFGAIDLRSSVCESASGIEASTQAVITAAAAANVRVLLATLPPSAFCTNPAAPNFGPSPMPGSPYAGGATPGPVNGAETQRMLLNSWFRSTGATLPGVAGIVDYDKALLDPANPDFMIGNYNSGDNFHPDVAGYQAEINSIPLTLLLPPNH
jgi:lysophospholipase L1-like esterase